MRLLANAAEQPKTIEDTPKTLSLQPTPARLTSLVTLAFQALRAQRHEDERRLAEARLLLMRLIGLSPNGR
jgi:hypothetical protein